MKLAKFPVQYAIPQKHPQSPGMRLIKYGFGVLVESVKFRLGKTGFHQRCPQ